MVDISDRVVKTLARLQGYSSQASPERVGPAPITIALSRQAGSRGAEIARAAGARLGWPVYDQELLQLIAAQTGLHTHLVERLDEHYRTWLEEMARAAGSNEGGRDGAYLQALLNLVGSLSKAGHCIIVGRGAAHVLPEETTLRVRVIAARAARIAQVQKSRGLSAIAAEHLIDSTDRERQRFIRGYFHADVIDSLAYDLVLRSDRLGVEECASLIAQAVRVLEARARR
jgi:cytidylate kinase